MQTDRHKKFLNQIKKTAFTLAEVLVTLAIIGVVAALTVPTLITNIQDTQNKTAFKKFYSDLAQANIKVDEDHNGSIKGLNVPFASIAENYIDNLKLYMSVVKQCGWAGGGPLLSAGNCWHADGVVKYMDGSPFPSASNQPTLIFSNGAIMMYYSSDNNCVSYADTCVTFIVDVNGLKGPNTVGKDIYYIGIQQSSIRPMGNDYDTGWDDMRCEPGYEGRGCAFKVLTGTDY